MRGSTLLRVLSNGRGTFLAAGGILGVGIYGFIATFEPYNSGRVMHPLPAVEVPHIAASFGPLEIFPAAGPREAVAELAPEPTALGVAPVQARAVPQPSAPSTPSAVSAAAPPPVPATTPPPLAAAGGGGIEPLSPVASDPPTGMGPVAGEAGESLPRPSVPASPSSPDAPRTAGPAGTPADGDDDDDGPAEPDAPPLDNKGNGKGNAEERGNGNAANQGKAKGHEK